MILIYSVALYASLSLCMNAELYELLLVFCCKVSTLSHQNTLCNICFIIILGQTHHHLNLVQYIHTFIGLLVL